ncbi:MULTISPECIES: Lrp/AsnC family transcriptional regulator [Maribacter]|uniref:Lrp/AsnC family transcriptional regulator, leucine-responsive regulatory protein n=1 Tax=Maribacter dokdonensis TaxID=320912 RepID=A0ABY0UGP4_9FLAO|nr:Lrp/AsnC family transcriptional regulator [Maribacter dokdonensis]MDP2527222.1 Lrp/AsnC family transcriptional regulator [Maribacter dokdonensis]SDS65102.1 Lrp/AsnC family transcriptional regulator, leucine-responsive regulatory protein [Maribacter dokdonensis]
MKLDQIDNKLLELLQEDSKKTTKEYALKLGLSTTAIYERIKRLEREGAIRSYVALVDKTIVNRNFTVFCHVKLVQHVKDNIAQFEAQVMRLQEVVECHHLSGDYDYLLKIHVKDMEAYRHFMVNKLTTMNHIGSTQSSFTIKEVKHSTAIPL